MRAKQLARTRRKRHEEAAAWALRRKSGEQSAGDDGRFQAWLDSDPENRVAYAAAERLMGDARAAILSDPDLRSLQIKRRPSAAKTLTILFVAAAVAAGAFVSSDGPIRLQADAISNAAEMPVIALADGSTMQLNAHSAVSYRFSSSTRTVVLLRGQAFFQVAKDPDRPFVVEAGGGRTTALGTAFDVRMGDETTDVTVTEHRVSVAPDKATGTAIELGEGQQAVYSRDGKIKDIRTADIAAILAWRRGQLMVDNVPLAEVVREIDRHFAGHIVIADQGLSARRVSGTFNVINTDAALALLQGSLNLTVIKMGPLIIIRG